MYDEDIRIVYVSDRKRYDADIPGRGKDNGRKQSAAECSGDSCLVGIALEIVSIGGFIYMTRVIPEIDLKALLFYSAPIAGILYGIIVFRVATKTKRN